MLRRRAPAVDERQLRHQRRTVPEPGANTAVETLQPRSPLPIPTAIANPHLGSSQLGALRASVVSRLQRLIGNAATSLLVHRSPVVAGTKIAGFLVTQHAEDRAAERGVTLEAMQQAVQSGGQYTDSDTGGTVYYDHSAGLAVIVQGGSIVTTYYGAFKRRRWS